MLGGIFVVVMLFLTLLNPIITANKPEPYTGAGNTFRQLSYTLLFLFSLWGAGVFRNPKRALVLPWTLIITLAWCWLSLTWAIEPSVAVRRLILTTSIIWSIFLIVETAGYEATVDAMRLMLTAILFVNFVAVIVAPSYAIHQAAEKLDPGLIGNWRGVLPQKNFTGAFCAFTIMVFWFDAKKISAFIRWGVLIASAFFLYKTVSKTSEGILVLSLFVGWLFTRYDARFRSLAGPLVLIVGAFILMIALTYGDVILAPFNRADALTGRVQIWPSLLRYSGDHLMLGSGYGSFWNIGPQSPIYQYSRSWIQELTQGHDGYIDILIQIGVPGLVLVILAVVVAPFAKLMTSLRIPKQRGGMLAAMMLFCIGHNLTESSVFDRDQIVQVFLMFAIAMIGVVGRQPLAQAAPHRARYRTPEPGPGKPVALQQSA